MRSLYYLYIIRDTCCNEHTLSCPEERKNERTKSYVNIFSFTLIVFLFSAVVWFDVSFFPSSFLFFSFFLPFSNSREWHWWKVRNVIYIRHFLRYSSALLLWIIEMQGRMLRWVAAAAAASRNPLSAYLENQIVTSQSTRFHIVRAKTRTIGLLQKLFC